MVFIIKILQKINNAWKYGGFPDPYLPVFGVNTDQKNLGHLDTFTQYKICWLFDSICLEVLVWVLSQCFGKDVNLMFTVTCMYRLITGICQGILVSYHCVKNVQIRNFFWSVFFRIQFKYEKIRILTFFTQCKWLLWILLLIKLIRYFEECTRNSIPHHKNEVLEQVLLSSYSISLFYALLKKIAVKMLKQIQFSNNSFKFQYQMTCPCQNLDDRPICNLKPFHLPIIPNFPTTFMNVSFCRPVVINKLY